MTDKTATASESTNGPTLHHLTQSQSQRILWLLEELSIPYNLVTYPRIRGRAPRFLSEIHPLGRSPTLVTASTPPQTLIESSAIAAYLIAEYDRTNLFRGTLTPASLNVLEDEELTSFADCSLGIVNTIQLFMESLVLHSPFFIRPLIRVTARMVESKFTNPQYEKLLGYLDAKLGDDRHYFMGERPGKPDFMLSWPVDMIVQRGWAGGERLGRWKRLKEWYERCEGREAWKRAREKGGDYDLTMLGKEA